MILYNRNDPGFRMDMSLFGDEGLTSTDIRGFFLKSDLLNLLGSPQSECVGIRFYNIKPDNGSPKIIASGAKEDGFDIKSIYLVSQNPLSSTNHLPASSITDRDIARILSNSTPQETQFMSFLSRASILDLLSGDVDGLGLAEVDLAIVTSQFLSDNSLNHLIPIMGNTKTHLVAAMNLQQNSIDQNSFLETVENFVSVKPCPGHCLALSKGRRDRFPDAARTLNTDPYLFKWNEWN